MPAPSFLQKTKKLPSPQGRESQPPAVPPYLPRTRGLSAGDQHRRVLDNGGRTRLYLLGLIANVSAVQPATPEGFSAGNRIRLSPCPDSLRRDTPITRLHHSLLRLASIMPQNGCVSSQSSRTPSASWHRRLGADRRDYGERSQSDEGGAGVGPKRTMVVGDRAVELLSVPGRARSPRGRGGSRSTHRNGRGRGERGCAGLAYDRPLPSTCR